MYILGIETSCDETAAAILSSDGSRILSNIVYSQIADHQPYGGVVPEVAARRHVEVLPGVLEQACTEAGMGWGDIGAVAVTCGPGLASSLLVGVTAAKALSLRLDRPLYPVNHLEGHLCSVFLGADGPRPEDACPLLVLLVTGGHTCLVHLEAVGRYHLLGQTLDDAAGEALDKGASMLGLAYPGGPAIEAAADGGDPTAVKFPRGRLQEASLKHARGLDPGCCFSFSGLKTSLLYHLRALPGPPVKQQRADLAASYQEAVFDALVMRIDHALDRLDVNGLACVGGVARNRSLRSKLEAVAKRRGIRLWFARPDLCTDNAAMIAAVPALRHGSLAIDSELSCDVQPGLGLLPTMD